MGIQRENGYSASVEAFLSIGALSVRLAKVGRDTLAFAEPCEFPPGTEGDIVVSIDGHRRSRRVVLADGVAAGERVAS
ncbi:MAG: hypothetical protein IT424_03115 [Pirellulales bacterium]|nr:hypothetical protein [Pirellulales bacterium]